jgi:hypothetical protein
MCRVVHAEQLFQPLAHLTGGFVGERDRHDVARRNLANLDEIGHAVRQHARLAGTRAGQHQHRAVGRFHGLALLRVQVGEQVHSHLRGMAFKAL